MFAPVIHCTATRLTRSWNGVIGRDRGRPQPETVPGHVDRVVDTALDIAVAETFPHTRRYAAELTAGEGHDRFDFALDLMLNSLEAASARAPGRLI